MNSNNVIKQIKDLMVKYGFVDAKLEDGTEIKVDGDLEVGDEVVVVLEDSEVPAPDGEHVLDSGEVIQTEEGVIVEVEKSEEEKPEEVIDEEVMEEEVVKPEIPEEIKVIVQEVVDAIIVSLEPILAKINGLSGAVESMKSKFESIDKDFDAFKKQPGGKKINDGKSDFSKEFGEQINTLDERVKTISQLRKNK